MARTTLMRHQTKAAAHIMAQIGHDIADHRDHRDTFPLSLKLAKFMGVLRTHFAQQEQSLFPFMINSGCSAAARAARAFHREMAPLRMLFDRYCAAWAQTDEIAERFAQFRRETETLFAAITDRLRREHQDLYPLADAAARGDRGACARQPVFAERLTA